MLKEEQYVQAKISAPPRRVELRQLWQQLPNANQKKALLALGRIVANHIEPPRQKTQEARHDND